MNGAKFIEHIKLKNILSFGNEGQEVVLEPLNVLIGPNSSGKSNLIEIIDLLHAAPKSMAEAALSIGNVEDWMWKGSAFPSIAEIEAVVYDDPFQGDKLQYVMYFRTLLRRFTVVSEILQGLVDRGDEVVKTSFYSFQKGKASVYASIPDNNSNKRQRQEVDISFDEQRGLTRYDSILSQLKDPLQYHQLAIFSESLDEIQIYRGFDTGKYASLRQPQRADLPNERLLGDASNLGLVLNRLEVQGQKRRIVELLRRVYDRATDFTIHVQGNTVQFYLHEEGLTQPIAASRLSDGMLHFLCLVAILVAPSEASLICIEEPEIGLHPDAMPLIAELLVEASQRTQIIVTTHSEALVSALSQTPEAIIVCERDQDGTKLRRLEAEQLREWLERYTLGDLWRMGEIGGTRW